MSIVASAPGKLLVLGEYAVLDGAPALVMAVNRRASVTVSAAPPPPAATACRISAPDIEAAAAAHIGPDGEVAIEPGGTNAAKLNFVMGIVRAAANRAAANRAATHAANRAATHTATHAANHTATTAALPPFDAAISTAEFFGEGHRKFGLGSSAAVTVAVTGALHHLAALPAPTLSDLVATHRALQGGRGSGADIAAALTGGVIEYRSDGRGRQDDCGRHDHPGHDHPGQSPRPHASRTALPGGVQWRCVWTGRSTSTATFLAHVAAWRVAHPADYAAHLRDLAGIAQAGAQAARDNDAAAFLAAVSDYGAHLDRLGQAADTAIVGAEHRQVGNLAARYGVIYKPSGAGGGDVGLAFADDPDRLEAFRQATDNSGYRSLDVAVDPPGLTVDDQRVRAEPAAPAPPHSTDHPRITKD